MEVQIHEKEQNLLPPVDWAAEIQNLKEELVHERERNVRTLADFKNYRRRIERDAARSASDGMRGMLLPLLDIVDDLEKALQWSNGAEQPSIKGIQIIHKKFLTLLDSYGVLPFDSTGTPFDHNLHEAVAMVSQEGHAPGLVVDELRRGYRWNNEVLRHAQVRVAG